MVGRYPGRLEVTSSSVGQYQSIAEAGFFGSTMSFGMSTSTGPGRPVVAMWKACRMASGMSSARVTSSLCLVTDRVMPIVSHSWNASVPIAGYGTWPVMTTIGTESM